MQNYAPPGAPLDAFLVAVGMTAGQAEAVSAALAPRLPALLAAMQQAVTTHHGVATPAAPAAPAPPAPPPPPPPPPPRARSSAGFGGEAPAAPRSIAGAKLRISCGDAPGTANIDLQVVECYCAPCCARVAAGHDRPLFSFTRFERHAGSRAKKWRASLRVEPGSAPECPAGGPSISLGQWLDARGAAEWTPRTVKIGPALEYGGGGGGGGKRARPADGADSGGSDGGGRFDFEAAPLPGGDDPAAWLAARRVAFDSSAALGGANPAARHAAVSALARGLLGAGAAFSLVYLPWLGDLPPHRLAAEFATLRALAGAGAADGAAAAGAMRAMRSYIAAALRRAGSSAGPGAGASAPAAPAPPAAEAAPA